MSDLAWGARQGVALAAIVLIPAAIVAVRSSPSEFLRFVLIGGGYLVFGTIAGLVIGAARGRLKQRSVAIAVGAIIGATGLSLLLATADTHGTDAGIIGSAALLGLVLGAFLGWWAWRRAAFWKLR